MLNNINTYLFLFILFLTSHVFAQHQDVITLSAPESGEKEHIARQKVEFNAGYKYASTNGNKMHAEVDPALPEDISYDALFDASSFDRPIDQTKAVGSTVGSHGVSPSGAATYSIPISIPQGTMGMQPTISLAYNSQSGNGKLGRGWGLSGLSSITRVSKNIFHDDEVAPINGDLTDQYSMDGNRLILLSGTHGQNNAVYGTHIETFSRITAKGSQGLGPQYFIVEMKNGLTYEYGRTEDARFLFEGDAFTVLSWQLNKVKDCHGNYMEYVYKTEDREIRIDKIIYTGNTGAGLDPYNEIKFHYDYRDDKNEAYVAGSVVKSNLLLTQIDAKTNGNDIFRSYKLSYAFDATFSYFQEIEELGFDGASFNTLRFRYGENAIPYSEFPSDAVSNFLLADYVPGDFNGDGLTDIFAIKYQTLVQGGVHFTEHTNYELHLKNPVGQNFSMASSGQLPDEMFWNEDVFDIQEEKVPIMPFKVINDLVMHDKNLLTHERPGSYERAHASSFVNSSFNKDNRQDILMLNRTKVTLGNELIFRSDFVKIYMPNASGNLEDIEITNDQTFKWIEPEDNHLVVGDFNGDGETEYMTILGELDPNDPTPPAQAFNHKLKYSSPSDQQFNLPASFSASNPLDDPVSWAKAHDIEVVDFDGDGDNEIMIIKKAGINGMSAGTEIYDVEIGNNGVTLSSIYSGVAPSEDSKIWFGDFNGDGKTDYLTANTSPSSPNWFVYRSTGTGFTPMLLQLQNIPQFDTDGNLIDDGSLLIGDYDGNGMSDIIYSFDIIHPVLPVGDPQMDVYYSYGGGFRYWSNPNNILVENFAQPAYMGDYNGDGRQEILYRYDAGTTSNRFVRFNLNARNFILEEILDGFNNSTEIEYASMTYEDTNPIIQIHEQSSNAVYPLLDVQLPAYVVKSVSRDNGIGGTNITEYRYEGAKSHALGKGFLGFDKVLTYDLTNYFRHEYLYETDDQFYCRSLKSTGTWLSSNNSAIRTTDNVNEFIALNNGETVWKRVFRTSSHDYLKDQLNVVERLYDTYGNIINIQESIGNTETKETTYNNFNSSCSWIPNKPEDVEVKSTRDSGDPIFYSRLKNYYNSSGSVTKTISYESSIAEPKALITEYLQYDQFGHPLRTTISSPLLADRTSEVTYDRQGRFVRKQVNALGQSNLITYHPVYGKPIVYKSIDDLETKISYDGFCREKVSTNSRGRQSKVHRIWDIQTGNGTSTTVADNSLFYIWNEVDGKPDTKTWYDKLGRVRLSSTELINGDWTNTTSTYNAKGYVQKSTYPYMEGTSPQVEIENQYDAYNRIDVISTTGLNDVDYDYVSSNGEYTVSMTNSAGQESSRTTDASGKLIESTDEAGTVEINYYPHGGQKNVLVNGEWTVLMSYDQYGRQTALNDRNAGTTIYEYNAYSELEYQKDSRNNETDHYYDVLGRLENSDIPEGSIEYDYITEGSGLNLIKRVTGPDGAERLFTYDQFNRVSSRTDVITGTTFVQSYVYDLDDNIKKTTYPGGLTIKREYYSNSGYIKKVTNSAGNSVYFHLTSLDAFGNKTDYSLGNGLTSIMDYDIYGYPKRFTTVGAQDLEFDFNYNSANLSSRTDHLQGLSESFTYDDMNRLTNWTVGSNVNSVNYLDNGNILSKSDVSPASWIYNSPLQHHAVQEIPNPTNVIPSSTQSITYNTAQQPETLIDGNKEIDFTYGPYFAQRSKTVCTSTNEQAITSETRYFLGDHERRVTTANVPGEGTTQDIYYIAGDGLNLIVVKENGVFTYNYVYTDHLGSILTITDDQGSIEYEANFDPWGRRRNTTTWSYAAVTDPPSWLLRGFTGHEHLPKEFKTINMNGRLYDPLLGRMLSVDNFVADESSTQAYNRYAYALNNPLKYIDPSGETVAGGGGIGGDPYEVFLDFETFYPDNEAFGDFNGLQGDILGDDVWINQLRLTFTEAIENALENNVLDDAQFWLDYVLLDGNFSYKDTQFEAMERGKRIIDTHFDDQQLELYDLAVSLGNQEFSIDLATLTLREEYFYQIDQVTLGSAGTGAAHGDTELFRYVYDLMGPPGRNRTDLNDFTTIGNLYFSSKNHEIYNMEHVRLREKLISNVIGTLDSKRQEMAWKRINYYRN